MPELLNASWSPLDLLPLITRIWFRVLVVVVLGASAGLGLRLLRAPQYESAALLSVRSELYAPGKSSYVVQARARDRVAGIVYSDATLDSAIERLPSSLRDLRRWEHGSDIRDSMRLDRTRQGWNLSVIDTDPQVAALIANAWAEEAVSSLERALVNSRRATKLLGGTFDVKCLGSPALDEKYVVVLGRCSLWSPQTPAVSYTAELRNAVDGSRGVPPDLQIDITERAKASKTPIRWGINEVVVVGILAALAITSMAWVLWIWWGKNLKFEIGIND